MNNHRRGVTRGAVALAVLSAAIIGAILGGGQGHRTGAQVGTPAADCPTTTPEHNKELVRRYFEEVYNGRNLDLVDDLLADDFGRTNPAQPHTNQPGNDDDAQRVRAWFDDFPDLTLTVDDLIAEHDRVAVRLTWRGTQAGALDAFGAPATGRPAEWSVFVFYRIACGQLVENWVVLDYLTMLRQLGIVADDELTDVATPTVATPTP